jgi:hypothetical protein
MAYDSQLVCWEFGVVHVSKLSFAPDGLNDLIDEQFPECRIVPPLPGLSLQNTVNDVDRRADTLDQLNLNSEIEDSSFVLENPFLSQSMKNALSLRRMACQDCLS